MSAQTVACRWVRDWTPTVDCGSTGKQVEADYVYVMQFEGDKVRHMTKIWNNGISLQQLGWT